MELFLQRMTSSGALSSDWGVCVSCLCSDWNAKVSYQVEAEQQRAEGGDEEDVDKVWREVAEPGTGIHGAVSTLRER